jgi:hypothetical protein
MRSKPPLKPKHKPKRRGMIVLRRILYHLETLIQNEDHKNPFKDTELATIINGRVEGEELVPSTIHYWRKVLSIPNIYTRIKQYQNQTGERNGRQEK